MPSSPRQSISEEPLLVPRQSTTEFEANSRSRSEPIARNSARNNTHIHAGPSPPPFLETPPISRRGSGPLDEELQKIKNYEDFSTIGVY
ncbi:hypothetical protein BC937DRAFT_90174 [Endogone sp. FLAS-F59071]|nr:hypothetical protein BC937DRAFT_90174 [Endogone sp. FLAS-F59071]|eukprot:RUS17272.1 hypothetical protein BC937DRAFT_90174 [Endogone sp. FLAS-F59071]